MGTEGHKFQASAVRGSLLFFFKDYESDCSFMIDSFHLAHI